MTEKKRTHLSPIQIYLRLKELEEWRRKAEKAYGIVGDWLEGIDVKILEEKEKLNVNSLLKELFRKTSAEKAIEVIRKISENFYLPDLSDFLTQERFSGMFGIQQVVNIALSSIYFESSVKKSFTDIGKFDVDYHVTCELICPFAYREDIQKKIDKNNLDLNIKLFSEINTLKTLHENRLYNSETWRKAGQKIQEITGSNPMGYLLPEVGVSNSEFGANYGKNFDFSKNIRNHKNPDLFFRFLCITFFSLEFKNLPVSLFSK